MLFVNNRKFKDNSPDYSGTFTDENGREFWISGWKKTKQDDDSTFLSLSFKLKDGQPAGKGSPATAAPTQKQFRDTHDDGDDVF